jgi:hypothetical protein
MTTRVLHLVNCDMPARTMRAYLTLELTDEATGKRYRATGTAGDTMGAVFGAWLWDVYAAELTRIAPERAWRHKVGKFAYRYFTADPSFGMCPGARTSIELVPPSPGERERLRCLDWNTTNNSASLYTRGGSAELFKAADAIGLDVSLQTLAGSPVVVAIIVCERAKDTQP